MSRPKLVVGANGFLGSYVVRQLVEAGHDVRIMVRPNAATKSLDNLELTRFIGDIWDDDVLRQAMTGCDDVYYCVVDTRAWLADPEPLYRTNVDGTRNVLDVACSVHRRNPLHRFVFTSSYATVGRRRGRSATEADEISEPGLTDYVRTRVLAERMVLARGGELPAVAVCVSTTYGAGTGAARRTEPLSPGRRSASCRSSSADRIGGRRDRRRGSRDDSGCRARPGR